MKCKTARSESALVLTLGRQPPAHLYLAIQGWHAPLGNFPKQKICRAVSEDTEIKGQKMDHESTLLEARHDNTATIFPIAHGSHGDGCYGHRDAIVRRGLCHDGQRSHIRQPRAAHSFGMHTQ